MAHIRVCIRPHMLFNHFVAAHVQTQPRDILLEILRALPDHPRAGQPSLGPAPGGFDGQQDLPEVQEGAGSQGPIDKRYRLGSPH
eukprot:6941580-Prymnesium_polylepis.2